MVMDPMGMGCFFPNEKFQKGEQDFLEGETKRLRDVNGCDISGSCGVYHRAPNEQWPKPWLIVV